MKKFKQIKIIAEGFIQENIKAEIIKKESTRMLVRLSDPIVATDRVIEYLVIRIRHEGENFDDIEPSTWILCNITATTLVHAMSKDPMDLSWWRGGYATVGSVFFVSRS